MKPLGPRSLVLLVRRLATSYTNKGATALANVPDPKYRVGQLWRYKSRPGEEQSTFTIVKVEPNPKFGAIIHVSIQGLRLHMKNPQAATGFYGNWKHAPFSRGAIDNSIVELLAENAALPDYEEGYQEWQNAKGGVWSITVAEAIQAIEDVLNSGSWKAIDRGEPNEGPVDASEPNKRGPDWKV